MLILHQTGSVRIGEVVRYTLTYTPSLDRILPPPTLLHVKIKNTSATPLRAAYLHGPYTLYVACYPSTFDPNVKQDNHEREGAPEFEPQLKAGGQWLSKLTVPEEVRQDVDRSPAHRPEESDCKSFTWIIEVASQVIFSTTAAVHFEVLVGRDEKSVNLGFHGVIGSGQGAPGKLEDLQQGRSRNAAQPKGVFSKAVRLAVHDTESLWNSPPFPEWDGAGHVDVHAGPHHGDKRNADAKTSQKSRKPKKVHLVILTHGLHSNLGADMLYMKESIDTAAKKAQEDAKKKKEEMRAQTLADANIFGRGATDSRTRSAPEPVITPMVGITNEDEQDDNEDEEQILVRGFSGNAVKTERGIQYLGKRLAKYVLSITYPDQPFLPVKSSISRSITRSLTGQKLADQDGKQPIHKHSSIVRDDEHVNHNLPYKITSISFVSHSLGGLLQTYAIAYIQKHSPGFFDLIKPINFVAMASPFLGLSNENPIYVKFALDFGLVGRTGQDLGLTWRAPTIARSGWGAMIGGLTNDAHNKQREPNPGSKPLLRILPTGPAHAALKKFRNRTVYSNVVNDGIVPLRTSCLLFLDWRGLERVEKARRDNGLVGTMVGWGWAEMTGQNASAPRKVLAWQDFFGESGDEGNSTGKGPSDPRSSVPQADASQGFEYEQSSGHNKDETAHLKPFQDEAYERQKESDSTQTAPNLWSGLMSLFRPQAAEKATHHMPKHKKIYHRGQITKQTEEETVSGRTSSVNSDEGEVRRGIVRGSSLYTNNSEGGELEAPPKTTFFESAGDLLSPPLPPKDFILDPAARPRTIFHDRVYHPGDIPLPPLKRPRTFLRRNGSREDGATAQEHPGLPKPSSASGDITEPGGMKIEEKIARAYHKDLSWRKVLVRLEPDAHNNMIVRRMFANAYGWPVIKHMCDTHFGFTAAAQTADDEETADERAKPAEVGVGADGEQVKGQVAPPKETDEYGTEDSDRPRSVDDAAEQTADVKPIHKNLQRLHSRTKIHPRTASEVRESRDGVADLVSRISASGQKSNSYSSLNSGKTALSQVARKDSAKWSDRFFDPSDNDSDDESYLLELEKARARGDYLTEEEKNKLSQSQSRRMSRLSTASDQSTTLPPPPTVLAGSGKAVFAEPIELDQTEGPDISLTGIDQRTLSLTGIGLRKSVEGIVNPEAPQESQSKGSRGVAEQVAIAQSKSS